MHIRCRHLTPRLKNGKQLVYSGFGAVKVECPRSDTEMFIEVFGIYFDENGKEISGEYPKFSIYQSQMPESLVAAMMNANMELALYLQNNGWETGDIETVQ